MRRFGITERLFYLCSGASLEGLAQCPESEHRKYGFIGSIILLTSMFAMLSGGYALYYIFHTKLFAGIFALLWGLFILNIDRLIVSSMRKADSLWLEFRQAIPRIILAFIIAVAISRPLEIGIFADEIVAYFADQKDIKKVDILKDFNAQIDSIKQGFNTRISEETALLEKYRSERETTCTARNKAHAEYICERDGTCGTEHKGYGPEARLKLTRYETLDRECTDLTARTTDTQDRIIRLRDAFDRGLGSTVAETLGDDEVLALEETAEINRLKEERNRLIGDINQRFSTSFASMNTALWDLQRTNRSAMGISLIVTLLFLVIETAPITVKLLAKKGPYDYYLAFERDRAEAMYLHGQNQLYEEKVAEAQTEMRYMEQMKEVETFKAFQAARAPIEKEVLCKVLEEWREKTELPHEQIKSMDTGLRHMLDDYVKYAEINSSRSESAKEPIPAFAYPVPFGEAFEEQEQEEEPSGPRLVVKHFFIVPMIFIVTVTSFMLAHKIQTPMSPYLVAILSGILYVSISIVYFSLQERLRVVPDEK